MKQLFFILLATVLFTSCSKDRLTGNDDIISEDRHVGSFTGIRSSGSTDVHVSYGTDFNVEIRGSSNLIPRYRAKVRNNVLELGYENHVNVHDDDIEVFVTMPRVSSISLSGSGDVDLSGHFNDTENFQVTISGSAEVLVKDRFDCIYSSVNISGSGNADLLPVHSERADVNISGSGDATVTVEDFLKARVSGSGKVFYVGTPEIDSRVSGSGKVDRL